MIHHALSRWLPPSKPVRRPFELIYAADECPPRGALGLLALQHAATVLALIAHVLAAAKIAGLSLPQTHSIVAMTLLGMATFMVGLVLIVPLLGHASWHAYRGSVEWEESPEEAVTLGSSN